MKNPTIQVYSSLDPYRDLSSVRHVHAVWPLSSVLLSHTVCSLTFYIFTYINVQTECALACAPLLFLNCDTKCYGPNWGVQGMLSPILSLSLLLDALQASEDGLGDFAVCCASILYDQSTPLALQNCGIVCHCKNRSIKYSMALLMVSNV